MNFQQFGGPVINSNGRVTNARDVLLVALGGRCFGLSLSDVRHICPLPPSFAYSGTDVEDHFVFQENPLRYVSLWDVLKLTSDYSEYEALEAMLSQRRQDHIDWMDALEDAIRYRMTFSKARNPRECAFGKWYYAYETKNSRLSLLMRHFEQPHREIHRLADKLLDLVNRGEGNEALRIFQESKNTTLAKLLELFDSTRTLVTELQRRIAVIVDADDMRCALGVDAVRDIVAVPAERIKPAAAGLGNDATSALIVLDDQSVIPMLNWRLLFTAKDNADVLI